MFSIINMFLSGILLILMCMGVFSVMKREKHKPLKKKCLYEDLMVTMYYDSQDLINFKIHNKNNYFSEQHIIFCVSLKEYLIWSKLGHDFKFKGFIVEDKI